MLPLWQTEHFNYIQFSVAKVTLLYGRYYQSKKQRYDVFVNRLLACNTHEVIYKLAVCVFFSSVFSTGSSNVAYFRAYLSFVKCWECPFSGFPGFQYPQCF